MQDLISRQAAIDAARKCSVKEVTPAYMLIDKAEIMTELMMLPSAEPELIRCKDCRYHMTYTFCGRTEDYCKRHESFVELDDFCSMAQLEDD